MLRRLLWAVTVGWIGLFGLGALLGAPGERGWLYFLVGAVIGLLIAGSTHNVEVPRTVAESGSRGAFVVALAVLTWGLVSLLQGGDPVTGGVTGGVFEVRGETLLLLSAGPACIGLLLLAMRAGRS